MSVGDYLGRMFGRPRKSRGSGRPDENSPDENSIDTGTADIDNTDGGGPDSDVMPVVDATAVSDLPAPNNDGASDGADANDTAPHSGPAVNGMGPTDSSPDGEIPPPCVASAWATESLILQSADFSSPGPTAPGNRLALRIDRSNLAHLFLNTGGVNGAPGGLYYAYKPSAGQWSLAETIANGAWVGYGPIDLAVAQDHIVHVMFTDGNEYKTLYHALRTSTGLWQFRNLNPGDPIFTPVLTGAGFIVHATLDLTNGGIPHEFFHPVFPVSPMRPLPTPRTLPGFGRRRRATSLSDTIRFSPSTQREPSTFLSSEGRRETCSMPAVRLAALSRPKP